MAGLYKTEYANLAKKNSDYSALKDCGSKKTTYSSIFAASSYTSSSDKSSKTTWLEKLSTASQVVGLGASCVALGNASTKLYGSVSGGETDSAEIAALKAEIQTNNATISSTTSLKKAQDDKVTACNGDGDTTYKNAVAKAQEAYDGGLITAKNTKNTAVDGADTAIASLTAELDKAEEKDKPTIQTKIDAEKKIKEDAEKTFTETEKKLATAKELATQSAKDQMTGRSQAAQEQSDQYTTQIKDLETKNKKNEEKIKAAEKKSDKDA